MAISTTVRSQICTTTPIKLQNCTFADDTLRFREIRHQNYRIRNLISKSVCATASKRALHKLYNDRTRRNLVNVSRGTNIIVDRRRSLMDTESGVLPGHLTRSKSINCYFIRLNRQNKNTGFGVKHPR